MYVYTYIYIYMHQHVPTRYGPNMSLNCIQMVNRSVGEDHHCWSPYEESVFERIIEACCDQQKQRMEESYCIGWIIMNIIIIKNKQWYVLIIVR